MKTTERSCYRAFHVLCLPTMFHVANCVRMILAEPLDETTPRRAERVAVLECTLDDTTPQTLAYACERLLQEGALDVFTTPIFMKKNRPGHNLTVLVTASAVTRPAVQDTVRAVVRRV